MKAHQMKTISYLCHEMNKAYCEFLGDKTIPPYFEAPAWMLESTADGIKFIIDNPNAGPSASHDNWTQHKLNTGWVYGKVKDAEEKTHPCLVAWQDLPYDQKIKDVIFYNLVKAYFATTHTFHEEHNGNG